MFENLRKHWVCLNSTDLLNFIPNSKREVF